MSYYHVRLYFYTQREPPKIQNKDLLNITRTQLEKEIIEPYQSGKIFRFDDISFKPSEVADFLIKATPSTVSEVFVGYHEEFVYGTDVTDQFLKKRKEKETIEETKSVSKDVFIVHGRDHVPMKELKTMLYDFGLNPIVLHEEASGGLTLPEKLERHAKDVGYAFVILTPEDVGGHRDEIRHKLGGDTPFLSRSVTLLGGKVTDQVLDLFEPRARQNVIFEMGYFWGLLERKRVCCLLKGNVEKPSDIEGIVYVHFKDSVREVKGMIVKELAEAGYNMDNRGEEEAKEDHASDMKKLRDDVEMLKRRGSYPH